LAGDLQQQKLDFVRSQPFMPSKITTETLGAKAIADEQLSPGLMWALFCVLTILAVVPFWVVRFPPINDYPSHLARIVVLSQLNDAIYSHFYRIGSFLLPNVALDAFAAPLAHLVGAESAVRWFVELGLVLTLLGAVALHSSLHRTFSPWPLLTFTLLHNGIFRFGFFNYLFGVALALLAGAAWSRMPRGVGRLMLSLASSVALIFCHLEALGVFAMIVAGTELASAALDWRRTKIWTTVAGLALSASPILVTLVLFLAFSPTASAGREAIKYAPGLGTKPIGALFSLSSGIIWLDVLSAIVLLGLGVALYWRRSLTLSWGMAAASMLALLVLYATPTEILGAQFADSRLGVVLGLFLLLSLDLKATAPRRDFLLTMIVVALLAVIRVTALTSEWVHFDREIEPIVSAFNKIEPGSTLFAATSQASTRLIADTPEKRAVWRPPLKHVASYVVLHAPVFVPEIWTFPTQQPLLTRDSFDGPKDFQGTNPLIVPSMIQLAAVARVLDLNLRDSNWKGLGPVYLLVIDPWTLKRFRVPPDFLKVESGERFILLKYQRQSGGRRVRA
jgi:hypothetical protein